MKSQHVRPTGSQAHSNNCRLPPRAPTPPHAGNLRYSSGWHLQLTPSTRSRPESRVLPPTRHCHTQRPSSPSLHASARPNPSASLTSPFQRYVLHSIQPTQRLGMSLARESLPGRPCHNGRRAVIIRGAPTPFFPKHLTNARAQRTQQSHHPRPPAPSLRARHTLARRLFRPHTPASSKSQLWQKTRWISTLS